MGKNIIKIISFLLIAFFVLSACCHKPSPPISQAELVDLRAKVEQFEAQVSAQSAEIEALEKELQQKKVELHNLQDYEQQLKDDGFLGEE